MQITFELVNYDEELDRFELDENSYNIELNDEEIEEYNLVKSSEVKLYKWLRKSETFLNYINEEVYQNSENKQIAISDINGISYRRFYFFKVTSGDSHYEYFKDFFNIYAESDWQDREDVGEEILQCLSTKRKELILNVG